MKTVDLASNGINIADLIALARQEPVLLLTPDGEEFVLSEADDFETEVATLRASRAFQQFLDKRSVNKHRMSLDEIERELEHELASPKLNGG